MSVQPVAGVAVIEVSPEKMHPNASSWVPAVRGEIVHGGFAMLALLALEEFATATVAPEATVTVEILARFLVVPEQVMTTLCVPPVMPSRNQAVTDPGSVVSPALLTIDKAAPP